MLVTEVIALMASRSAYMTYYLSTSDQVPLDRHNLRASACEEAMNVSLMEKAYLRQRSEMVRC